MWAMLQSLPRAQYHLYLDNLFVSNAFCEFTYDHECGVTGTCRTNSGIIKELATLKATDKKASKKKELK